MKKTVFWIISLAAPFLIVIAGIETYGAFFHTSKGLYDFDTQMGWVPKTNFSYNNVHKDAAGNSYDVSISTNDNGFTSWGDTESDSVKILFIGDSYTGGPHVSNEDSYFGQVKKLIGAEVFAIGAAGYSTLQELLLLQKYVDEISPDVFVLQFCTNDFVNNSFDLESKSILRNQINLRPYYVDHNLEHRQSTKHPYRFSYSHSRIFRFLDTRIQQIQFGHHGGYFPPPFKYIDGLVHVQTDDGLVELTEENRNSERITGILLAKMADTVPAKTQLLTFTCSTDSQIETDRWTRVARKAGFTPLPEVSDAVENAARNGAFVYASDGAHWSPPGHAIAGKVLADQLVRIMKESSIN